MQVNVLNLLTLIKKSEIYIIPRDTENNKIQTKIDKIEKEIKIIMKLFLIACEVFFKGMNNCLFTFLYAVNASK